MARTQEERKAETRERLVDAAADLFARKGFHAVSAEAVADHADRTTGALYAHFSGKEGLLVELLNGWRAEALDAVEAQLDHTPAVDDRLDAVWRRFSAAEGLAGDGDPADAMVLLEHELWLYAARNPAVAVTLADRYDDDRAELGRGLEHFAEASGTTLARPVGQEAALAYGLLLGLAMQHRIDPGSVPPGLAIDGLRRLLGLDRAPRGASATDNAAVQESVKNPVVKKSAAKRAAAKAPVAKRSTAKQAAIIKRAATKPAAAESLARKRNHAGPAR